jgi:hypothetical protein
VTLEGWRQFVNARPPTLKLIGKAAYEALGDAARADYDERRLAHHSELVTVETSTVRQIIQQGRLLMLLNQREISARRSLIVDGPWATGKSTTIKLLGRIHEQRVRRRHPDQDRIPVVYITTPWARLWPKLFPASGQGLRARRPDRGPEARRRCPDPASFGVQANCGRVRHAPGRPHASAFAWMVPGELALFGLDELERTKE